MSQKAGHIWRTNNLNNHGRIYGIGQSFWAQKCPGTWLNALSRVWRCGFYSFNLNFEVLTKTLQFQLRQCSLKVERQLTRVQQLTRADTCSIFDQFYHSVLKRQVTRDARPVPPRPGPGGNGCPGPPRPQKLPRGKNRGKRSYIIKSFWESKTFDQYF